LTDIGTREHDFMRRDIWTTQASKSELVEGVRQGQKEQLRFVCRKGTPASE
jgi:hypothetical protein